MSDQFAIEATGLEKSYGPVRVLRGVDLTVPAGTVFSLLGPNGAGKTTIIRILSTLSRADAGAAYVAGHDVVRERHQVRRSISLTGQHTAVDALLTGAENLRMMGRLAGLPRSAARRRATELIDGFDLTEAADRRVATYSGGMRRRLDLAASLVDRPSVIFLDEPTTGLDLRSRQALWQVIKGLADAGVTIFLTTQYLEEADQLADRVAVLDGGRVVAEGSPADLKHQVADQRLELTFTNPERYAQACRTLGTRALAVDPETLFASVASDGEAGQVRALLDEIDPGRDGIGRFAIRAATLDDVYLALTGHAATPNDDVPADELGKPGPTDGATPAQEVETVNV